MPRLVVLDGATLNPGDNPWTELEALGSLSVYDRTPRELVVDRARGADLVFTNKTPLDAAALAALSGLRGICVLATGVNVVDVGAARALGIPVCNVPAYSARFVAQHTIALLLELCNAVGLHDAAVHAGDWSRSPDFSFWKKPLIELDGLALGIVGYGAIGSQVAQIGAAFGMRVSAASAHRSTSAVDQSATGGAAAITTAIARLPLERLLAESDVVSLHCPLTPETERLLRWERLSTMKPSALVVNTARGGLIDGLDLQRALNQGLIAGAAVDVLSSEPPPADHPLLSAKNCIITPHLGWTSVAARRRLMSITVENARSLLAGRPIHVVE
jgi:glycerate dehydrogenase